MKKILFLMAYKSTFLLLFVLIFGSVSSSAQNSYSVKNRWTIKASCASYTTAFHFNTGWALGASVSADGINEVKRRKMVNFKMEANYGINKFIEIGLNAGFQHYEWSDSLNVSYESLHESFAPLFGINLNFHILPFLVTAKECKWDLYLTTKYGGCYLPHKEYPDLRSKFRQEYGLGMGAGYYFENIVGLFVEGIFGQFDYFDNNGRSGGFSVTTYTPSDKPEVFYLRDKPFRFRAGIAVKL